MLKLGGELLEGQFADHVADIDAHMVDIFQTPRTGAYLYGYPVNAHNTAALTVDQLLAGVHFVARSLTIDRIAVNVSTAGAAGKKARLGIYANGENNYPGALVLDAGTVDVDSTGIKSIIVDQVLSKGIYWFVVLSDDTPNVRKGGYAVSPIGIYEGDFSNYWYSAWYKSQAYGALPDPFPSGGARTRYCAWVLPRIASLD